MSANKLQEVLDRLKKQKQNEPEPVPVQTPEQESEENEETSLEQQSENRVKEISEPVDNVEKQRLDVINKRITELKDDGVFRLNLLIELSELHQTIQTLTATIMKIGGIDSDDESKKGVN